MALGPLLSLLNTNGLPSPIKSRFRLIAHADDCVVSRVVHSATDVVKLQEDSNSLEESGQKWKTFFNIDKGHIMHTTDRSLRPTIVYISPSASTNSKTSPLRIEITSDLS